MSKQSIQQNINNALGKEITRAKVQSHKGGHLLVLQNESIQSFYDTFNDLFKGSIDSELLGRIFTHAVKKHGYRKAQSLQQWFEKTDSRGYNRALRRLKGTSLGPRYIRGSKFDEGVFLLAGFGSANSVKEFIADKALKLLKRIRLPNIDLKTTKSKGLAKIDRGHGVGGFAVSEVKIAQKMNLLNELSSGKISMKDALMSFGEEYEISVEDRDALKHIATSYDQIITPKGRLQAGYVSVLSFQTEEENQKIHAQDEQRVLNIFNNRFVPYFAKNVLNMEGSSSLFDKIVKDILTRISPKKTKYVQIDFKLPKGKLKTSGKANTKYSDKPKGNVKKVRHKAGKVKRAAGRSENVLPDIRQFIGVLNSRINTQVAKNMGSPRLNYRTGRFAESVRITDISKTTQGFPSIGYTYMREPYEVFEFPGTGNPLAQQGQRDPRSLIELSIREIMAQYAIGRFYTRRL